MVGKSKVEVSVSDSGTGIPDDKLKGVFEPFYTTKPQGTGLGLSISRAIIEAYGGKIWAENRPGGGATFRFTLPLAKELALVTDASPIIHVVDDDPSFRAAIASCSMPAAIRSRFIARPCSCWRRPSADEPACILLDVQMPGVDGPQLQARLAELGHRLPIVFLTGHGDIPTSVQAIKAGADDFLTKPVRKEKLLQAIERALAHGEQVREQDRRVAVLRSLVAQLTPRERDVFDLFVRGKPHKQIAYALGTTERTVKMHRHNLMQKCQVQSLADLAVIAERLGLLPAPGGRERGGQSTLVATLASSDDGSLRWPHSRPAHAVTLSRVLGRNERTQ